MARRLRPAGRSSDDPGRGDVPGPHHRTAERCGQRRRIRGEQVRPDLRDDPGDPGRNRHRRHASRPGGGSAPGEHRIRGGGGRPVLGNREPGRHDRDQRTRRPPDGHVHRPGDGHLSGRFHGDGQRSRDRHAEPGGPAQPGVFTHPGIPGGDRHGHPAPRRRPHLPPRGHDLRPRVRLPGLGDARRRRLHHPHPGQGRCGGYDLVARHRHLPGRFHRYRHGGSHGRAGRRADLPDHGRCSGL